jgi:hypothetical protein
MLSWAAFVNLEVIQKCGGPGMRELGLQATAKQAEVDVLLNCYYTVVTLLLHCCYTLIAVLIQLLHYEVDAQAAMHHKEALLTEVTCHHISLPRFLHLDYRILPGFSASICRCARRGRRSSQRLNKTPTSTTTRP